MINTEMREYNYYIYDSVSAYGQAQLSEDTKGSVKMTINLISQSIQNSMKYKDASYLGLTNSAIDDTYVIQYGDVKLKVLYVNPKGRYKQVYMAEI